MSSCASSGIFEIILLRALIYSVYNTGMNAIPLEKRYVTPEMEDWALSMGANQVTVWSWRRRGVPLAWRIKLVEASEGKIKFSDFKRPKKVKSRG